MVRERPLGEKAESDFSVGFASRVRGSDPRVSRKQLAGHVGPTLDSPVTLAGDNLTRPMSALSPPDPTRDKNKYGPDPTRPDP